LSHTRHHHEKLFTEFSWSYHKRTSVLSCILLYRSVVFPWKWYSMFMRLQHTLPISYSIHPISLSSTPIRISIAVRTVSYLNFAAPKHARKEKKSHTTPTAVHRKTPAYASASNTAI
jgi:hypothetical protein